MQEMIEEYREFFDLMKVNRKKSVIYDEVYFVAIDAEWYESGGRNVILSYQLASVSESAVNNIILYMPPGKRMKLCELVEAGIKSVNGGQLPLFKPGRKVLVVLIAHNFTAEWSALDDRNADYITENLMVIRKTPVTKRAIKINLSDCTSVDVHFYDSMHLAPAGYKSLQAMSTLLGEKSLEKDDISQTDKENMNLFLQRDPVGFERYALRDTEVTLRLFVLLQKSLNMLAYGEIRQLFRTLAAASVDGFLESNPWFVNYRKALRRPEFWDAKRLAERAFHGGRNEGFFVGRTEDHPESQDKVWVDVDFSGCYPTAMALCPKIKTEEG